MRQFVKQSANCCLELLSGLGAVLIHSGKSGLYTIRSSPPNHHKPLTNDVARPKVARAQGPDAVWIITRARAAGPFRIEPEWVDLSGVTLSLRLEVGSLLRSVDEAVRA